MAVMYRMQNGQLTPSFQAAAASWHGVGYDMAPSGELSPRRAAPPQQAAPPPSPPPLSYKIGKDGEREFYGLSVDQLTNIADPWASQRGQYQTALSKLISDPSSFTSSPIFQASTQAGIDAVNRQAASRGLLKSGNRLTALMDYGQQKAPEQFFKMADLLTTLGGARNQNPGGGLTAAAQLSGAQTAAENAATNRYQAETQRQAATSSADQARQNAQQQAQQFTNTWQAQQQADDFNRQMQQYQDQQRQQQSMQQSLQNFMNQGRDIALNYR